MQVAAPMALAGALQFNPFEGDFGEQGDRTLSDSLVHARKQYRCSHCMGPVLKGEIHRSRRDVISGDVMSWRWCHACCTAMVQQMNADQISDEEYEADPGMSLFPYEARHAIHQQPTRGER